ncbi:hypothetical protein [Teretinema zuelzerae]|uniref:hypothetical protein n=1 Tax=Teretinema zuelzerae TaxID=156 RepID=UPI001E466CD4|nr:hypothetical protein [Teretinema zuelzerae]
MQEKETFLTRDEAIENGYTQLGIDDGIENAEGLDRYHEMGNKHDGTIYGNGNDKFIKPSVDGKGSYELVFDKNGNLVTDSINGGTYNFSDSG